MGRATTSAEAQKSIGGSEAHHGNRDLRWVSQGLNPSCELYSACQLIRPWSYFSSDFAGFGLANCRRKLIPSCSGSAATIHLHVATSRDDEISSKEAHLAKVDNGA